MRLTTSQRQTGVIALAVLLVTALGMAGAYTLIARDLTARQQQLVQADLDGFAALYDQRRIIAVRQAIDFRLLQDGSGDILLALQDRAGTTLAGNATPWPAAIAIPPEGSATPITAFTHNATNYTGLARTLPGGFPLLAARATTDTAETLAALRRIFAAVLAATILISLAVGHIASRWTMARVARINALADRVATGDLAARLRGPPSPDEFGLLETHIHRMLDRIESLNRATHHLSDTIAHELRTPLTRIQSRLAKLDTPDAQVALQDIRDTIRVFDSLLQIARAEAGGSDAIDLRPLDLTRLARDLAELYEPLAEDRNITFHTRIDDGISILGDRNLVAQLISNLLDNALKFSPPKARVELTLTANRTRHDLTISDSGPGLPDGFEAILFDRFSRAERDIATTGHGLGMALVRAIAVRHGAKLSLPATERGFSIRIAWPSLPANQ